MESKENKYDVLHERAVKLSHVPVMDSLPGEKVMVVEFHIEHERYAIDIQYVKKVSSLKELTPLPCAPLFLIGMVNIRGQVIAVLDIRQFLNFAPAATLDDKRILILEAEESTVAILADDIIGVYSLDVQNIQLELPILQGSNTTFLRGITPDHVIILDGLQLLMDQRILINEVV